jgi:hypothetical protein
MPKELVYLEGLVKFAKRLKDEELWQAFQVASIYMTPTIRRICVNKTYQNKLTLHLTMEI